MFWMTVVSFRRNFNKYSLAIISLALAVLVSCLGLSGLSVLQRATLQPLIFIGGGQIIIADARTELQTSAQMVYADPLKIKPFPAAQAEQVAAAVLPRATAQSTLIAPYLYGRGDKLSWIYVGGRDNPSRSLSQLQIVDGSMIQEGGRLPSVLMAGDPRQINKLGDQLAWDGATVGQTRSMMIPPILTVGQKYDWSVPQAVQHNYRVAGIYNAPATLYWVEWTDLTDLQEKVGGDRPISWLGIDAPLTQLNELKQQLEDEIAQRELPLQVMTIYDMGSLLIGDFERFEKMADYYAPVMLFVAIMIVLVNAIALTLSRRKELALLRTIGFSLGQIQVMFIVECIITALCAGLIGTGLAALTTWSLSRDGGVSWLPFLIAVVATTLVGSVTTLILTSGSLSKTLRNPLE